MSREIVLVGGGHAHVEVIRQFGLKPIAGAELTVIDPNSRPVYSGMVPGFVANQYELHELQIDLAALCQRVGARFIDSPVTRVLSDAVELRDEATVNFDIASLDIGSTVSGLDKLGVKEFTLPSRPISALVFGIEELLANGKTGLPFYVIGAGAGGVELAFCVAARLHKWGVRNPHVVLVTSDPVVLLQSPPAVRARVKKALGQRDIKVLANSSIARVHPHAVELASGEQLPSAGALWVTGPAAHPLASASGLPIDETGFIRVAPTFQVAHHENLFAVGDCASLDGMRKAGVYAVRAGPLLDANLRAHLAGTKLIEYKPQDDFLSLLNLGDGSAIGSKWGLAFEGRAMMWLKDKIDRSFMEKYK